MGATLCRGRPSTPLGAVHEGVTVDEGLLEAAGYEDAPEGDNYSEESVDSADLDGR